MLAVATIYKMLYNASKPMEVFCGNFKKCFGEKRAVEG
jgi:hypothetical protein